MSDVSPQKGTGVPATWHNPIVCEPGGRFKGKAGGVNVKVKVKGEGGSSRQQFVLVGLVILSTRGR